MPIREFGLLDPAQIAAAARILREAIAGPSYKAPGEAEAETASFLGLDPNRFALAAMDRQRVLGWVGAVKGYSHSLELHPLVVDPASQRRGVGRSLVAALEARAKAEGYLAIHLGADDEVGGTSLFGVDAFPHALAKLAAIRPTALGHPFFFYRRLGYEPVGIIPDANGFGKPDILMSKRLAVPDPGAGSVDVRDDVKRRSSGSDTSLDRVLPASGPARPTAALGQGRRGGPGPDRRS
jgi:aminoglycoside 6'-N-acetyltransferase I